VKPCASWQSFRAVLTAWLLRRWQEHLWVYWRRFAPSRSSGGLRAGAYDLHEVIRQYALSRLREVRVNIQLTSDIAATTCR